MWFQLCAKNLESLTSWIFQRWAGQGLTHVLLAWLREHVGGKRLKVTILRWQWCFSILLKCTLCLLCLAFKQVFHSRHCHHFPIWNSSWEVQNHGSESLRPGPPAFWAPRGGRATPNAGAFALQPLHWIPGDEPASWTSYPPVAHENQAVRGRKKGAWVNRKIKHFTLSTFKTVLNVL